MTHSLGRRAIPAGLAAISVLTLGLSACSGTPSADAGTSATPRAGGTPVDVAALQHAGLHDQPQRDPAAAPFDATSGFGPDVTPHLVTATSDDHAAVALPSRLQAVADTTGTSLIDGASVAVRRAAEVDSSAPADRCLVTISAVRPDGARAPGTRRGVEQLASRIVPGITTTVHAVIGPHSSHRAVGQWAAAHPGQLATDADARRLAISGPCDAASPVARITLGTPDVGATAQISTRIVAGEPTLTIDAPVHGATYRATGAWVAR